MNFSCRGIAGAVTLNTVGDLDKLRELKRATAFYPLEIIFPLADRFDYLSESALDDLLAHLLACEGGLTFYVGRSSRWSILTASFLKGRRSCCSTGCRHCPFEKGPRLSGRWVALWGDDDLELGPGQE